MTLEADVGELLQSGAQVNGCGRVVVEHLLIAKLHTGLDNDCDNVLHALADAFLSPDALIGGNGITECFGLSDIPGSKTTLDDARWLAASGIGACVRALSGAGTPVLGICGGYQLLGDELSDPHGREGAGAARGLGLIPASTVFKEEKRLAQSELRITGAQGAFSVWNGMTARGYEIHDGETTVSCAPAGTIGGKPEGAACRNVFGTYLHGLFDEPGVALALARSLARMRGLPESVVGAAGAASAADHRAREFDRLADVVRGALDMEYVYRIIEEGV